MTYPTPGQRAFNAYREHAGGRNHDSSPTPEWDDLNDAVRSHWEAAAAEVLRKGGPVDVIRSEGSS